MIANWIIAGTDTGEDMPRTQQLECTDDSACQYRLGMKDGLSAIPFAKREALRVTATQEMPDGLPRHANDPYWRGILVGIK